MRHFLLTAVLAALGAVPALAQPYPPPPPVEEGLGNEALLSGIYAKLLGRRLDPGAGSWLASLGTGASADAVAAGIMSTPEYYNRGGGTPRGFIRRAYIDLTGRPPTPPEERYWAGVLFSQGTGIPSTDRQQTAAQLLARYPQDWGALAGGAPGAVPVPPPPAYDYRRPYPRYRDHDHDWRERRERERDRRDRD